MNPTTTRGSDTTAPYDNLDRPADEQNADFTLSQTSAVPSAFGALDPEEKARLMAETADAVRAEDVEVLDLRPLTIIADYFMICTGKSSIQLRAIADRIEDKLREAGVRKPRVEGYQEATWILLDYGDVVAHLMAAEQRDFYRLEEFWAAAPRLELNLMPEDARATRPLPSRFETLTEPEGDEDEEDEDDLDEEFNEEAEGEDENGAKEQVSPATETSSPAV